MQAWRYGTWNKCDIASNAVKSVRKFTKLPLVVKLSPNAENIANMAYTCREAGGWSQFSLVNTFNALAIDIYNRKPIFKNITAGLSGAAIKPIALRMVREVSKRFVDCPVNWNGGHYRKWQDAISYYGWCKCDTNWVKLYKSCITVEVVDGIKKFWKREY